MAKIALNDATIVYGAVDLSAYSNQFGLELDRSSVDVTNFASSGWSEFVAGLRNYNFSVDGFIDSATADPEEELYTETVGVPVTVSITNPIASGDTCYVIKSLQTQFRKGISLGNAASVGVSGVPQLAAGRGVCLHKATEFNSTSNATSRQLGAVALGQKLISALHVTAISGSPTLDVVIRSDDNSGMTTPTTRLTHAQKTAVGYEILNSDGTAITDTWFDATMTFGGTGSIDFVLALGIG